MVIPPDIFREIQGQALPADAALGRESSLEVAPEPLQAVDVGPGRPRIVPLAMVDQPVDVTLRGDAGVAQPSIGTHDRPPPHPAPDEGQERFGLDVRHDLGPDLPAAAEDPEHRDLGGASPPLGAPASLAQAFVLPLAAHVGLVHFHNPTEHLRHLVQHPGADQRQRSQDPLAMQPRFLRNRLAAQPPDVPSQQGLPLMARHPQRRPRAPLVPAAGTPALPTSDNPGSRVGTSWTPLPFGHATSIAS